MVSLPVVSARHDELTGILRVMKHLFYVRHGETEMNVAHLLSGAIETPLTEHGRQQAMAIGKEIRERLPKVDLIISSPYDRAYQTAVLIADQIGYPVDAIEKNPLFVERTYGVLEGTSNAHFMQPGNYHELDAVEGAETIEALQERAVRAFDYLTSLKQDTILVVAHNAFGRALRRAAHHQPYTQEYAAFEQIPNATVLQLV
jgi:broad specificity phosphatase PhoE